MPTYRVLRGISLAGLLLIGPLLRGQPAYERFCTAANKGAVDTLHALAHEFAGVDSLRALSVLCQAAAAQRADDLVGALRSLAVLDSLSQDPLLSAVGLKFRALVAMKTADAASAAHFASKGLVLLGPIDHSKEAVDLRVTLAEALIAKGEFDEALSQLSYAQRRSEEHLYERGVCLIRFAIGTIRFKQKRYDEARTDFEASYSCALGEGADKLAMNSLSNLASVAIMVKRYPEALAMFDSVLTGPCQVGPSIRAHILGQQGFVRQKSGNDRAAIPLFEAAIAIRDSMDDLPGLAKILQHASTSYWRSGQEGKGISVLTRALQAAQASNQAALIAEIQWKLYERHLALGNESAALVHLRSHSLLSDSLNEMKYDVALASNEVFFETSQKERHIKEQEQALLLAEVQDRKKSFQRNVSIGVAALLLLIAALLYRSMRTRKRLAEKEKELHGEQVDQLLSQQEIKSINAMLEGQEKERDRVAKDLHDRLGSMLGGIKAQLGALEDRVEQVQHDAQFKKVHRLLDETVGELRQISHDMAASTLSRFGLEKALNDLRDTIHISGRLSVEMNAFGLEQRLERSVEIAVYRIIQELVSNVLKHAKAGELSIDVTRSPGRLSVIVSDNGIGFDTGIPKEGMGLENVRSRAAALGGKVQVDSTPGKGTTVSVECPVVE